MAASSRGVPRFLPTLTEIVHAPAVAPAGPPPDPVLDQQAIAERVRAQVDALVEDRLPALVSAALAAQVDGIVAQLRDDIEPLLREAVEEAVMQETGLRRRS